MLLDAFILYRFSLLNASTIGRFADIHVHVSCSAYFADLGVDESRSRGIWQEFDIYLCVIQEQQET